MGKWKSSLENMEMTHSMEFWKDKRVFVTGHTGLKGGWLSFWLNKLGARVTGYSLLPEYSPSFYSITELDGLVESIIGDIRDSSALNLAIAQSQPEIVFHLAAQPLVRKSYASPSDTFETNVLGTVNLFESVRTIDSVKSVVNVTTDKCYRNQELERGYSEKDPLGGADPYSCSKACVELISNCYRDSFFTQQVKKPLAMATARAGNVIGGGDWSEDRLIPDLVRATISNQAITLRYPDATRPWQHVLDCLWGYLLLAEELYMNGSIFEGPWNFGPDQNDIHSVNSVVEEFSNCWGGALNWEVDETAQLHETKILQLDAFKAKNELNWSPRWDFKTSLYNTVNWYISHYSSKNMRAVTENQIDAYMSFKQEGE